MESVYSKLMARIAIFAFLLYWAITFLLTIPAAFHKPELSKTYPTLNKLFQQSWPLFASSFNYNDKLYVIVRNKNTKAITDSLELLGPLAQEKQLKAPFNHSEFIIDRLLNHYVTILKTSSVNFYNSQKNKPISLTDSTYKRMFINAEQTNTVFKESFATVTNYCKQVVLEKNIDTTGKEFKIIIKEEKLKPFSQRTNCNYPFKQVLYFESFFNLFN